MSGSEIEIRSKRGRVADRCTPPDLCSTLKSLRLGCMTLLQKDDSINRKSTPQKITASHRSVWFCDHLTNLVQKIVSIGPTHHIAEHAIVFDHLANLLQKMIASTEKSTHRIVCYCFVIISDEKWCELSTVGSMHRKSTHRNAIIFCNHIANLLQKMIAST